MMRRGEGRCPPQEAGEIEKKDVSVNEDAPTEVEKEVEHEFDKSLPIINFKSYTSDEVD